MEAFVLFLIITTEQGYTHRARVARFDGPAFNAELCQAAAQPVADRAITGLQSTLGSAIDVEPVCRPARPQGIPRRKPE